MRWVYCAQGNQVASVDSDGVLKLWDVRMVVEMNSISAGAYPANKCAFERSGEVVAVASDDGTIKWCASHAPLFFTRASCNEQ